jgi:hypothetical protein
MIYTKANITDDIEIKVTLYSEAIFCNCPDCGIEVQVDTETLRDILQDGDLAISSLYCDTCSEKYLNKKEETTP